MTPAPRRAAPATATVLVLAIDDGYVLQAAVVLASLAETQPEPLRTVVLHAGMGADSERYLRRVGDRLGWPVELQRVALFRDVPVFGHVSAATYLRLHAPRVVDAGRFLYLDADLVVQGRLAELLAVAPAGPVAAVQDPFHRTFETGDALPGYRGGETRTPYFNAGVMVVDTGRWCDARVTERALRFLAETPHHVRFWDQCALNAVLEGAWSRIGPVWNCFPFSDLLQPYDWRTWADRVPLPELLEVERSARILHFAGPKKPWIARYPDGPNRRRYHELLATARRLGGHAREAPVA